MLLQLRDYVHAEGQVSLAHLARVFHTDESVLEIMLHTLVGKGMLAPMKVPTCYKGCGGCR